MRTDLLLIDPQVDFCESTGALFVPGATEDSKRMATMVRKHKDRITDIHVTMDTHHLLDIAHPLMYLNAVTKQQPNPLTLVKEYDQQNGVFNATELVTKIPVTLITKNPWHMNKVIAYVHELKARGRNDLCIWPPHCLFGSPGHCVQHDIFDALLEWETQGGFVDYVTKGSNMWTEHYSAVMADVPDPDDKTTLLNSNLINIIKEADQIPFGGQASSHCVKWTIEDIADNFGDENIKKFIFLEDASSPVFGFEQAEADFVKRMVARGMRVARTTDLF